MMEKYWLEWWTSITNKWSSTMFALTQSSHHLKWSWEINCSWELTKLRMPKSMWPRVKDIDGLTTLIELPKMDRFLTQEWAGSFTLLELVTQYSKEVSGWKSGLHKEQDQVSRIQMKPKRKEKWEKSTKEKQLKPRRKKMNAKRRKMKLKRKKVLMIKPMKQITPVILTPPKQMIPTKRRMSK